jgi:hypothetical protein
VLDLDHGFADDGHSVVFKLPRFVELDRAVRDLWAPDSSLPTAWAPDSEAAGLTLRRAVELFLAAKGAEGASPKTIEWYRMVLGRAQRDLGRRSPA